VSSVTIIRTLGLLFMANLLSMKALQIAGADGNRHRHRRLGALQVIGVFFLETRRRYICIDYTVRPMSKTISREIFPSRISKM